MGNDGASWSRLCGCLPGYTQVRLRRAHRKQAGQARSQRRLATLQASQDFRRGGALVRSVDELSDCIWSVLESGLSLTTWTDADERCQRKKNSGDGGVPPAKYALPNHHAVSEWVSAAAFVYLLSRLQPATYKPPEPPQI